MSDMKKILAFGDSIMKGVVVDKDRSVSDNIKYTVYDNCFTDQCSKRLGVEIENFGKFGSTIAVGKKILNRHIQNLAGAEFALLKFGGNDSAYKWNEIGDDPDRHHEPNTSLESFRQQYLDVAQEIKDLGVTPVLLSLPPIDTEKYYASVTRGMDERQKANVEKWLLGQPSYIYNWHEIYNLEIFKLAAQNNFKLIDLTSAFLERRDYKSMLCDDGMHPNERGHRLIADTICNNLALV